MKELAEVFGTDGRPDLLTPPLRPYAPDEMEARPVSLLVNSPTDDGERCVESLTEGA